MQDQYTFISAYNYEIPSIRIHSIMTEEGDFSFTTAQYDSKTETYLDKARIVCSLTPEKLNLAAFKIKRGVVTSDTYNNLGSLFPKFYLSGRRIEYKSRDQDRVNNIFSFLKDLDGEKGIYIFLMFYWFKENRFSMSENRKYINFLEILREIEPRDFFILQKLVTNKEFHLFSNPNIVYSSNLNLLDSLNGLFLGKQLEELLNEEIGNILKICKEYFKVPFKYNSWEEGGGGVEAANQRLSSANLDNNYFFRTQLATSIGKVDYEELFQNVLDLLQEFNLTTAPSNFKFILYLFSLDIPYDVYMLRHAIVAEDITQLPQTDFSQVLSLADKKAAIRAGLKEVDQHYRTFKFKKLTYKMKQNVLDVRAFSSYFKPDSFTKSSLHLVMSLLYPELSMSALSYYIFLFMTSTTYTRTFDEVMATIIHTIDFGLTRGLDILLDPDFAKIYKRNLEKFSMSEEYIVDQKFPHVTLNPSLQAYREDSLVFALYQGDLQKAQEIALNIIYYWMIDSSKFLHPMFGTPFQLNEESGALCVMLINKVLPGFFNMEVVADVLARVRSLLTTVDSFTDLDSLSKSINCLKSIYLRTSEGSAKSLDYINERALTKIYADLLPEEKDKQKIDPDLKLALIIRELNEEVLEEEDFTVAAPKTKTDIHWALTKLQVPFWQRPLGGIYTDSDFPYSFLYLVDKKDSDQVLAVVLLDRISASIIQIFAPYGAEPEIDLMLKLQKLAPLSLKYT